MMELIVAGSMLPLKSVDLFEALKKRRACRHFAPKPVPDDVLEKLADAAHKAPTGGNTPYRFVIVVKDPVKLKMLKLVAPGYFGDSSAALVVCTDLRIAEQGLGRLGVDQCSLYDAGAAAENIVLAGYGLGLGASFIKSYSETALKEILRLPNGYRTELVVSLGYPAENEPPPLKRGKGSKITYRDSFGQVWHATGSADELSMKTRLVKEMETPEEYIFELVLFLLTAARGCVTEPHRYGPLRLIDAASRVIDIFSKTNSLEPDEFLVEARKKIDDNKHAVVASEEKMLEFLEGLIGGFADELRRRYGEVTTTP
jgi:nitroreductase